MVDEAGSLGHSFAANRSLRSVILSFWDCVSAVVGGVAGRRVGWEMAGRGVRGFGSVPFMIELVREHTILAVVVGSRAYGLDSPGSDHDRRGVYAAPTRSFW